jgi:BirA family biotin operon repressor/biotin-[acetyl-CoA-carboxylase] ligase
VAVADHQTAGRGRLGRTWTAPPGANLLVSVLLRPHNLPVERRHLAVAAVAVAACDACAATARVAPVIKWPNDLFLDGRKLAGVLAESDGDAVVVGLGLNVGWAPEGAACLGSDVSRDVVLDTLLARLGRLYPQWDEVASAYRRRCATIGATVGVELADETFTGRALDVDDHGHLLVDVGACVRTVVAGDVVHLRPA